MRFFSHLTNVCSCGLIGLAVITSPVLAQPENQFYTGKTLSFVVGSSAGGGYDQYTRALARHLSRQIPGAPHIIVKNMPGAGSLTAVLSLAGAPKDGTVVVGFNPGLFLDSITAGDSAKAKFTDFAWLGSITRDSQVCYAWGATNIRTWADVSGRKETVFGATGANSNSYNSAAILRNVLEVNVRTINAYPGNSEVFLAVERGEIDGSCATWTSIPDKWIEEKKINVLVRLSAASISPMAASAPFIKDLAQTEDKKDLLDLLLAPRELGRPYILSKDVPSDRLQVLRAAFDKTVKDPEFLAEARKQGLSVDPIGGVEAEKIVSRLYQFPAELVGKAKTATK